MESTTLFKDFLTCPECKLAIVSKEKMKENKDDYARSKYCTKCGKEIASTYKEALAQI